jgi:hypothetical protein
LRIKGGLNTSRWAVLDTVSNLLLTETGPPGILARGPEGQSDNVHYDAAFRGSRHLAEFGLFVGVLV